MNIDVKLNKIEQRKKSIGSRNDRHLRKYSDNFNKMFEFYLKGYRSGILSFCGSNVYVDFNIEAPEAKFGYREYDNGRYKNMDVLHSRHPNILKGVITGKKAWGLWVKEWGTGINQ
jgi:hypothetical protein